MKKKVLFCANIHLHFKGFHLPVFQWFQEQGWEVHAAANGKLELPYTDQVFEIPVQRSPFRLENVSAYHELLKLINQHEYDIIHCHTPMGGMLARLAAGKARKKGAKVIYTAHGFHFYKGAPKLNWLLYYPIERMLAHRTDCLITINSEDYQLALDRKLGAGRVVHVHGVGVDTERFKPAEDSYKQELRNQHGFAPDDFLFFYAAEFNANKNQQLLIQALAYIKQKVPGGRLLLAGEGPLLEHCRALAAEMQIADRVHFLGYRQDIASLLQMCDVAVGASYREGLPVNIMEAMACGLPVIATANRGHTELVADEANGFIVPLNDPWNFAVRMIRLNHAEPLRKRMAAESLRRVQTYSSLQVRQQLSEIYNVYIEEETHASEAEYHHAYL
ncbi:glycosyl transferase [Paenibacillus swuensis]|uniref:Glycosyl transferase n=1 Tax=Paenibacillus swuensis TaxID=1178515 RepID=A0A172TGX9_9BACL|nr:glycosyltransferase family 4 protein [Paenibacillus swuensis]ANE46260.1 glycosyl transferase [Paenibacillus swuensis]